MDARASAGIPVVILVSRERIGGILFSCCCLFKIKSEINPDKTSRRARAHKHMLFFQRVRANVKTHTGVLIWNFTWVHSRCDWPTNRARRQLVHVFCPRAQNNKTNSVKCVGTRVVCKGKTTKRTVTVKWDSAPNTRALA